MKTGAPVRHLGERPVQDPNRGSDLFIKPYTSQAGDVIPQHFLQIAINPIPLTNGTMHECSVTRHWTVSMDEVPPSPLPAVDWGGTGNPAGRPERVGNSVVPVSPVLNAPLFANAGTTVAYSPDESGVTSFNLYDFAAPTLTSWMESSAASTSRSRTSLTRTP